MYLWRGLAGVGVGALAVAGLALGGTIMAVEPASGLTGELVVVAYLAFFLGVAVLLSAALARGLTQVNRAIALARRAE